MDHVTFQAMVVYEEEGRFVRRIETRQVGDLPKGEVLIRVGYSSVNWKDCLSAMGNRGVSRHYPHTPGIDAAGMVAESFSEGFGKGERVLVTGYDLGMNTSGGFAEYIRVPSDWVVKLPEGLTRKEAMMLGTAGFTAGLSVKRLVDFGIPPERGPVLVTGATGGVGGLAIGILKKLGYSVTAVSGRTHRPDYLKEIGADEVLSLSDMLDESGKPMGKPRWASVVETLGGPLLTSAIKQTEPGGVVTCCGNILSGEFSSSIYPFILRGVSLCGINSATCPMAVRQSVWKSLATSRKPETLDTQVSILSGLDALDEQIERMVSGERVGRSVVHLP